MTVTRRNVWMALAIIAVAGGLGSAGGFVIGRRWPPWFLEQYRRAHTPLDTREWTPFAQSDFPRYEPGRARVGNVLYIFGGFYTGGDPKATARLDALDLVTRTWTRKHDMPVALTHAAPTVLRDTVWFAGGFEGDHPGPATSRVWRYVPASDEWIRGPDLPEARGGGALVAAGDTLHYFGGWMPDRNTDSHDHWTLRIGDSAWRAAPPLPIARGHLSGVRIGDGLYAVSGNFGHDPIPIDTRSMQRFDLTRRQWTDAPSGPFATSHTEGATMPYEGGFVSVGGRSKESGQENLDDVMWFDASGNRWLHLGRFPVAALGLTATIQHDTLIAGLGALHGNNPSNAMFWSTPLRNAWHVVDSMPLPLGEVAGGVINGRLYLTGQGSAYTFAYDMASGHWLPPTTLAVRPMPGNHQGAEVVEGKLVLVGGMDSSGGIVQQYDPASNTWQLGPPVPFRTGSAATAVIGGRIYVAGGIVGHHTTSSAAVLNLTAMTWTPIAPMPLARNHAASATDGERWYVFGGRGPGSGDDNEVGNGFADVQCYDPRTNTWTRSDGAPASLAPMPVGRGGTGKAVFINGEFWVIGGETLNGAGATALHTYARVDIYNPSTNQWRQGPSLPTARHGIFPVVDDGQIVVAGGGPRAGFGASNVVEMIWPKAPNH